MNVNFLCRKFSILMKPNHPWRYKMCHWVFSNSKARVHRDSTAGKVLALHMARFNPGTPYGLSTTRSKRITSGFHHLCWSSLWKSLYLNWKIALDCPSHLIFLGGPVECGSPKLCLGILNGRWGGRGGGIFFPLVFNFLLEYKRDWFSFRSVF